MASATLGHKDRICISLDKNVLAALDAARGTFDRSSFINEMLYFGLVATDEQLELCNQVI